MKLTAIVLTYNEDKHLSRCLTSLNGVVDRILVVDSYSTDDTLKIAREYGVQFVEHTFVNQANQFNWALTQLEEDTDWIIRIDADEYITSELANELLYRLPMIEPNVDGILCGRRMVFQGKLIRYGGMSSISVLRIFRYCRGKCENRWMDEHIKVTGPTITFKGNLIDNNLNTLTWWINKHNNYANREAVDLLNLEYGFMKYDSIASLTTGSNLGIKRWIKENLYSRLPCGSRALFYFLYRYLLRFGFLDGKIGFTFHFLQCFWYRYLVDAKVVEVKRFSQESGSDIAKSIEDVLGIQV